MKKFFENVCVFSLCVALALFAFVAMSFESDAVFTVNDGVYYHRSGDCAIKEKSHNHDRKISICTKDYAETKMFLPCRKCCQ